MEKKDFAARFKVCEFDEVCPKASPFGNTYYKLTPRDVETLLNGKVLYDVEEYGTFIMLDVFEGGRTITLAKEEADGNLDN